jgi:hypothetical protein
MNVIEFANYICDVAIPRMEDLVSNNTANPRISKLWTTLRRSNTKFVWTPVKGYTLDNVVKEIKAYKVVYYFDVRHEQSLNAMTALINFAFHNQYEVFVDPKKGRGLKTLVDRQRGESIKYGGRWQTQEYEQIYKRLQSHYVLQMDGEKYPKLKSWSLDGERYFKLGELGRWVNTATFMEANMDKINMGYIQPTTESVISTLLDVDRIKYNVTVNVDRIRAGTELLVRYNLDDEKQKEWETMFLQPQSKENATILNGTAVATSVVFPNEVIVLKK